MPATQLCPYCLLPHAGEHRPLTAGGFTGECAQAQAETMKRLIGQIGRPGTCSGCHREIFWIAHRNGRVTPYTAQGLNHFIDCPAGDRFKKGLHGNG